MVRDKIQSEAPFSMKVPLVYKLIFYGILLVFTSVGGVTYCTFRFQTEALQKKLVESGRNMVQLIATSMQSAHRSSNWVFVNDLMREPALLGGEEVVFAQIVKPNGDIYISSDRRHNKDRLDPSLLVKKEHIIDPYQFKNRQENGILLVCPVSIDKDLWFVVLGLSDKAIEKTSSRFIQQNILLGGFFAILAVIISFCLAVSISKPLVEISRAAQVIADGNWHHTVRIGAKDEFGMVAHAFNRMVANLNKTKESLHENEAKYRMLTDNVSDIIWSLDENLRFTYVSPSVKRLLGYEPHEAIGQYMAVSLTGPSRRIAEKAFGEFPRTNLDDTDVPRTVHLQELEQYRKDGTRIWTEVQFGSLHDTNGRFVGFIGTTRGISKRKEAEEVLRKYQAELEQRVAERTSALAKTNDKLKQEIAVRQQTEIDLKAAKAIVEEANRAKSEFLANMSHELRTPLNHIIGFSELVLNRQFGTLNDLQNEYMNDVLQSSKHLLALINDILDLSRIESGKIKIDLSEVNLKSCLENSLVMIKEKAVKHAISVETNIDAALRTVTADERKLKQILYNLLSNAVKFTPNGGRICLSAKSVLCRVRPGRRKNDWPGKQIIDVISAAHLPHGEDIRQGIEISVLDSGIGIQSEDLERIFNRFEQINGSRSQNHEGSGLGLALTKELVELHGGKIWAQSDGPGKGSLFCFILPQ